MKRHARDTYYVVGEGILTHDDAGNPVCERPSTVAELRKFRFSRLGPAGQQVDRDLIAALATAMTAPADQPDSAEPSIPAGFTYLGQFVDHDLTADKTAVSLGTDVTVDELIQGRSPSLDLDSLYGRGPGHRQDARFYEDDSPRLRTGTTSPVPIDPGTNVARSGFDLPRVGAGSTKAEQRTANIPDGRNDENLAVAQTHLQFIHFHNQVVDRMAAQGFSEHGLFRRARAEVVRHYQWMLLTDFLPRIVDPAIVEDVFTYGRRHVDVPAAGPYGQDENGHHRLRPVDAPTMPIEFSVAAYRLGHSMARATYQWNRVFRTGSVPFGAATLFQLFTFSGTSGILTPVPPGDLGQLDDPNGGTFLTLPTNWIADFRRLYDFSPYGRPELLPPQNLGGGNVTKRIDSLLVNPLADLPAGSFGGRGQGIPDGDLQRNLAFRNLVRANMVHLASGQQMAAFLGIGALTRDELLGGAGGADLSGLTDAQRDALTQDAPLWFYVLREAELNGGRMTGVGGRLVAEVFHRAMEAASPSIVRDPYWRPSLGPDERTFRMTDLLLAAAGGRAENLNPLGDAVPAARSAGGVTPAQPVSAGVGGDGRGAALPPRP
jgi:Animal haem peroxidase